LWSSLSGGAPLALVCGVAFNPRAQLGFTGARHVRSRAADRTRGAHLADRARPVGRNAVVLVARGHRAGSECRRRPRMDGRASGRDRNSRRGGGATPPDEHERPSLVLPRLGISQLNRTSNHTMSRGFRIVRRPACPGRRTINRKHELRATGADPRTFWDDSWRNVCAGELDMRPQHAPTTSRWPPKRLEPSSQWFTPLVAAVGADRNDWADRPARKEGDGTSWCSPRRDPPMRRSIDSAQAVPAVNTC
jgi:hypothetical protein